MKSRNLGFFFSRIARHSEMIQDKRRALQQSPGTSTWQDVHPVFDQLDFETPINCPLHAPLIINLFQSSSDTFEQTKAASVQCLHA